MKYFHYIYVLSLTLVLQGCSTYVENKKAEEFVPIHQEISFAEKRASEEIRFLDSIGNLPVLMYSSYNDAKQKYMKEITVEGADLAFEIGPKILKEFNKKDFPLLFCMLEAICNNKKLIIDW